MNIGANHLKSRWVPWLIVVVQAIIDVAQRLVGLDGGFN